MALISFEEKLDALRKFVADKKRLPYYFEKVIVGMASFSPAHIAKEIMALENVDNWQVNYNPEHLSIIELTINFIKDNARENFWTNFVRNITKPESYLE